MLRFFARRPAAADPFPELTAREREILDLLAGLGNSAIATRLGLSPKTVANHLSATFAKLQVADRSRPSCAPGTPGSTGQDRLLPMTAPDDPRTEVA